MVFAALTAVPAHLVGAAMGGIVVAASMRVDVAATAARNGHGDLTDKRLHAALPRVAEEGASFLNWLLAERLLALGTPYRSATTHDQARTTAHNLARYAKWVARSPLRARRNVCA